MPRLPHPARLVLSSFVILASLLLLHPVIAAHISTHYLGGSEGDGGLYVWLAHAFHADPAQALTFETNALYPYGLTRAWSDSFLLPSALVHLLALAGLSLPLSYNVVTLAALTLNGVAASRLSRALGASPLWSLTAGVTFANSSYLFGNIGHPQLLYFFWVPLAWSLVITGAWSARRWAVAGLCAAASFYCAVYYAVFAVLGLGMIALLRVLSGTLSVRRMLTAGLAVAVGLVPVAYALPAYLAVQAAFGERHLYEAAAFAATGLSYLSFSPLNSLWGATASLSQPEATLCAGYLATVAALVGAFARSWRRAAFLCCANATLISGALIASSIKGLGPVPHIVAGIAAWLTFLAAPLLVFRLRSPATLLFALAAVFFVLSLGPGGEEVKNEPMWAPLALLYGAIPGLDAIRAVGRYGAVVVLAINVALALTVSAVRSRPLQALLGVLLVVATVTENRVRAFSFDPPPPAPLAFAALSKRVQPSDAAIVLPFTDRNEKGEASWHTLALLNTKYSLWAAPLKLRLVNGYSGQRSRLQYDLSESLLSFPSSQSVAQLSRVCGLRWAVVVPSLIPSWDAARFESELRALEGRVAVEERLSDGSLLLSLHPSLTVTREAPATVLAPRSEGARLSFQVEDASEPCALEASAVREGAESVEPQAPLTASASRGTEGFLNLPALPGPAVRPGIFKVAPASGCAAKIACSIR